MLLFGRTVGGAGLLFGRTVGGAGLLFGRTVGGAGLLFGRTISGAGLLFGRTLGGAGLLFDRTVDKKMSERLWAMLYEPVRCTGFPLFQIPQGVEVPEECSPSQSKTPSVSIHVPNPQHSVTQALYAFPTNFRTIDGTHR